MTKTGSKYLILSFKFLIIFGLLFSLTSCVGQVRWAEKYPETTLENISVSPKVSPKLYYNVTHNGKLVFKESESRVRQWVEEILREVVEANILSEIIFSTFTPLEKALYCQIEVEREVKDYSKWETLYVLLGGIAFDEQNIKVTFNLTSTQGNKKTYTYSFTIKFWVGYLFIPFNLFQDFGLLFWVPGEDDAYSAVIYQFLMDAKRDGFLQ